MASLGQMRREIVKLCHPPAVITRAKRVIQYSRGAND